MGTFPKLRSPRGVMQQAGYFACPRFRGGGSRSPRSPVTAMFEDDPSEYIRRDIEGSDSDTRPGPQGQHPSDHDRPPNPRTFIISTVQIFIHFQTRTHGLRFLHFYFGNVTWRPGVRSPVAVFFYNTRRRSFATIRFEQLGGADLNLIYGFCFIFGSALGKWPKICFNGLCKLFRSTQVVDPEDPTTDRV